MIGKNTIKLIKSLAEKKQRLKEGLFLVEGDKNVAEVLRSRFEVVQLFATNVFFEKISDIKIINNLTEVSKEEINKASLLKNPQNSIALCKIPETNPIPQKLNSLTVYLDDIQDPGNMGTIIRICDWFGIEQLFCSDGCADFFNPKVIQASMGSFCRVNIWKSDFKNIVQLAESSGLKIFGAFLEGDDIYTQKLPEKAMLVLGNEGNGISEKNAALIGDKLKIPDFSVKMEKPESLNVAIATALICSEFRRQSIYTELFKM